MSGDLAVQYAKLPEWLLARRVIPDTYARLLLGVDAKVTEALAESISDETAKKRIAESRDEMTYYAAKDIYEALAKSPEGQAKTLLGKHTHPGTAKWKAVVDAYRHKNLRWASTARVLIQNVSYEIPAIKKQVASCDRQVTDCNQRQADLVRSEAAAKERYAAFLSELGIEGFDPRRELFAYAGVELPKIHTALAELLKGSGSEVAQFYEAFSSHVTGEPVEGLLPLLRAVARLGSKVRAEDVMNEVPSLKERSTSQVGATLASHAPAEAIPGVGEADVAVEASGGINWGAEPVVESSGGAINWDFEVVDGPEAAAGINWGGAEEAVTEQAMQASDAPVADIDWGAITMEGLEVRGAGEEEATAGDENAVDDSLLDDAQGRELLLQEVVEADSFLQTRLAELTSMGDAANDLPQSIQRSLPEVKALADVTNKATELLAGKATQRLLLMRTSERYLQQQVRRIDLMKAQCVKPVTQRAELEKLKAEQSEEARRARVELDKLRTITQKLHKDLEAELSAHFKVDVRIVGDIAQI
mmetsp:Transcript_40178/g.87803  ORF Transcript_40178/g.87803 Transcript_40178/m.87803 type:complete len:532 (+) Transcript_40178:80-1675(+)